MLGQCRVNVGHLANIKHTFLVRFINFKEGDTPVEHGSHPVASETNQDVFPRLTLINLRQKHAIHLVVVYKINGRGVDLKII